MGRFLRALFYYVSGQFIWGAKALEKDPHVITARFDAVTAKLWKKYNAAKDAAGGIIALRERRNGDLERLQRQANELQETMEGAEALAEDRVKELRATGKSDDEIQQDAGYKEFASAHSDAESSLAAVNADIDRVKEDIAHLAQQAKDNLIQLQEAQREIQEVERKKHVTIMDVTMSTQAQEIQDALAGIASTDVSKELTSLEDLRLKARGDAEVSRQLSGADVKLQASKLRAAAHAKRSGNKLAAKLGLGQNGGADSATRVVPVAEAATGTGGKGGSLPGA